LNYLAGVAVLLCLVIGAYISPWLEVRYREASLTQSNFRGKIVTPSLGAVIPFAYLPAAAIIAGTNETTGLWQLIIALLGMGFVGLIDDLFVENIRGYSGHINAWKKGKLTTGMLKALWGMALGLLLIPSLVDSLNELVVGLFIFLFWSNGLNQLDRRPGRALKGFFLLWIILITLADNMEELLLLLPMVALLLVLLPADLSEKAMLGDAGANALGAALGIFSLLVLPNHLLPWWLVGGGLLNLIGERYSLSSLIERSTLLDFIDGLGRDKQ